MCGDRVDLPSLLRRYYDFAPSIATTITFSDCFRHHQHLPLHHLATPPAHDQHYHFYLRHLYHLPRNHNRVYINRVITMATAITMASIIALATTITMATTIT